MKKILIVEGNLSEENKNFSAKGIQTHTKSLKDSLNYYTKDLQFDVINPSSDKSLESTKNKLSEMAFEDPSTSGNPKKLTKEDMKLMYQHSISGELF